MFAVVEELGRAVSQTAPLPPVAPIRLLVVDDHPAVRRGVRELLEDHLDLHVIATVSCAEEALSLAESAGPDVAVVDYQLEGRSRLWLSRKLKRLPRPPRVVIYSAYADGLLAAAAVLADADALVSKGSLGSALVEAIQRVVRGGAVVPALAPHLAEALRCRLDDQQQAIFGMRLAGIPSAEVARILDMSTGDLDSLLGQMVCKLEPCM
jgi:DNA-binding NarL/FixJ family response regulator